MHLGGNMLKSTDASRGKFRGPTAWLLIVALSTGTAVAERAPSKSRSNPKRSETPAESADTDAKPNITVRTLEQASSSREIKEAALRGIPTDKLTESQQDTVDHILTSLSLFRRLPTLQCEIAPSAYQLFVEHPDLAVGLWRAMGISKLQLTEKSAGRYSLDTCDGTVGSLTVLHRDERHCLVLCEGSFKSPLLVKPIVADALFNLETKWVQDKAGTVSAIHRGDLFVSFPSQTVETVAKVISPMSNRVLDKNFEEVSIFARMMHVGMTHQPGWVEQTAAKLEGVPTEQSDSLLRVTAKVYSQHQKRTADAQPAGSETR